MANSLFDLWGGGGQGYGGGGMPYNTLAGLGMGLLSGTVGNPYGAAMQGFQSGAQADAAERYRLAQMRQHAADRAQAQANADRAYKLQERQFEEANWAPGTYKDANTEQEYPYQQNKRTGDIRWLMGKPGSMGGGNQFAGGMSVPYVGGGPMGTSAEAPTTPAFVPPSTSQYEAPPGMRPSEAKAYRNERAKLQAKRDITEDERKGGQQRTADVVTQDIDRAINTIEANPNTSTGLIGSVYGRMSPGSPAGTLAGLLTTIKANTSFDKLQQMRQASPTGGALGSVSDKENQLLQAAIGDLEQSRNPDELKYNLDRVRRTYQEIIHGPGSGGGPRYQPPSTKRKEESAFSPKGGRSGGWTPEQIEAELRRRGAL